jgi:hypothetical protein
MYTQYGDHLIDVVLSMLRFDTSRRPSAEFLYDLHCRADEQEKQFMKQMEGMQKQYAIVRKQMQDEIRELKTQTSALLEEKNNCNVVIDEQNNTITRLQVENEQMKKLMINRDVNTETCPPIVSTDILYGITHDTLCEWNMKGIPVLRQKKFNYSVRGMARLTPTTLVIGNEHGEIHIVDTNSFEITSSIKVTNEKIKMVVALSPTELICVAVNDAFYMCNLENDSIRPLWSSYKVHCIALVSSDVIANGGGNTIQLRSISTGHLIAEMKGHSMDVCCLVKFSSEVLVSGSADHSIMLWDSKAYQKLGELKGHAATVISVIKVSDDTIASASFDKTIRLWKVTREWRITKDLFESKITGECVRVLEGHRGRIMSICMMAPNILTSGGWNELRKWDTSGKCFYFTTFGKENDNNNSRNLQSILT